MPDLSRTEVVNQFISLQVSKACIYTVQICCIKQILFLSLLHGLPHFTQTQLFSLQIHRKALGEISNAQQQQQKPSKIPHLLFQKTVDLEAKTTPPRDSEMQNAPKTTQRKRKQE